jgi:DNA polymerase-1
MPMSDEKIAKAKTELVKTQQTTLTTIMQSPAVKQSELLNKQAKLKKINDKLKTKQHTIEKFANDVFNPNSGLQLQVLLYEVLGLPVLEKTDTGQPSTGGDVLKMLQNHCKPGDKELLNSLVKYSEADKILSTFIPAFENGILKNDSARYLHGSFNLGGTVSGRLSSSDPNLQNIPSNSAYGKSIKECFVAPSGWLFCGADFSSLEDRISALLTKDANKLKVYTDGFDGHALRAVFYYQDEIKGVDINDVNQVNSIADKSSPYYSYRQESKAPTFLLTYGGTYHGLISNCGFTLEKAKAIENSYHVLYKESGQYVQRRIKEAANNGYTTVAFGLRVRAPLLKQVMWETDSVPNSAKQESRTLGNAFGQSYGLLNNRATNAFIKKVWKSKFRYSIFPVGQIHDATYFLIKDDLETLEWANKELIIEMEWQELTEIQHPDVHLGAALDVFKEGWHKPITLPNNATQNEIKKLLI